VNESDKRLARIFRAKQREDIVHLTRALTDHEHRHTAAKFLADLGATESAPQIERLLDAKDARARRAAARALGRLKVADAAPRLREVARTDEDVPTRAWAVAALGAIGGDGALGVIAEYLSDPVWMVRRGAGYSLGVLGEPAAIPLLRRAKRKQRPWRRRVYRDSLRWIKSGQPIDIGSRKSGFERFAHLVAQEEADDGD
jgi:HEAT repeat protein